MPHKQFTEPVVDIPGRLEEPVFNDNAPEADIRLDEPTDSEIQF